MLYQSDALLGSLTVLDNVMLPLRELTDLPDAAIERAARARLALMDVLETSGREPSRISGGQRKRVALARATLDPLLLFCDEPTSALDPLAATQVENVLRRLRDAFGMRIIAVTHDPVGVRNLADRVVVLGDGAVRASGSVSEVERQVPSFFARLAPAWTATVATEGRGDGSR